MWFAHSTRAGSIFLPCASLGSGPYLRIFAVVALYTCDLANDASAYNTHTFTIKKTDVNCNGYGKYRCGGVKVLRGTFPGSDMVVTAGAVAAGESEAAEQAE